MSARLWHRHPSDLACVAKTFGHSRFSQFLHDLTYVLKHKQDIYIYIYIYIYLYIIYILNIYIYTYIYGNHKTLIPIMVAHTTW